MCVRACVFFPCVVYAARLGGESEATVGSTPERRVRRLLSLQRYLHSSRLLRGTAHQIPLPILDEDYTGQARVRSSGPENKRDLNKVMGRAEAIRLSNNLVFH